jgi:hypothetical protein
MIAEAYVRAALASERAVLAGTAAGRNGQTFKSSAAIGSPVGAGLVIATRDQRCRQYRDG